MTRGHADRFARSGGVTASSRRVIVMEKIRPCPRVRRQTMAQPGSPTAPIVLVLGSRNRKKCREMAELIAPPWEPSPALARLDDPVGRRVSRCARRRRGCRTFAGNARKKASELARALRRWVVADDSGLAVDALGGAPGVLSARYAGEPSDDAANNRKLLEALDGLPDERRGAAFRCALALADPSGTIRLEAEGALPRTVDPRASRPGRVRLRPAVSDPGISPDVRRAEPAGQAPAQPPCRGPSPACDAGSNA